MNIQQLSTQLSRLGYCVIPDWDPSQKKFEIIIRPWNWKESKPRVGRIKRTGFFFKPDEVNRLNSPYRAKLLEVQRILVEYLNQNHKNKLI